MKWVISLFQHEKVFTIQGTYPAIRESLRDRGWVEKMYKLHVNPKGSSKSGKKKKKKKRKSSVATIAHSDSDGEPSDDDEG